MAFLPKYSPDLNPIEQLFTKLKHCLRNAAERTREAVCQGLDKRARTRHRQHFTAYGGTERNRFLPDLAIGLGKVGAPDDASGGLFFLP